MNKCPNCLKYCKSRYIEPLLILPYAVLSAYFCRDFDFLDKYLGLFSLLSMLPVLAAFPVYNAMKRRFTYLSLLSNLSIGWFASGLIVLIIESARVAARNYLGVGIINGLFQGVWIFALFLLSLLFASIAFAPIGIILWLKRKKGK